MKGEIMKVRLDINQQYTEEQIIIEAPALSSKIQKVQDFVQSLDQKETIKGKFQDQVYLIQISKIQRVYIENRKVLAETDSQTYALDIRLYQASEILPASFIQISQSEIVNIDAISHLKLTSNGLIEIYLKNESFTYSSRRYLKTIKEKLELWKNKFSTMPQLVSSSASSYLLSFLLSIHQATMHHLAPTLWLVNS